MPCIHFSPGERKVREDGAFAFSSFCSVHGPLISILENCASMGKLKVRVNGTKCLCSALMCVSACLIINNGSDPCDGSRSSWCQLASIILCRSQARKGPKHFTTIKRAKTLFFLPLSIRHIFSSVFLPFDFAFSSRFAISYFLWCGMKERNKSTRSENKTVFWLLPFLSDHVHTFVQNLSNL